MKPRAIPWSLFIKNGKTGGAGWVGPTQLDKKLKEWYGKSPYFGVYRAIFAMEKVL
jgi:hypothetical protein